MRLSKVEINRSRRSRPHGSPPPTPKIGSRLHASPIASVFTRPRLLFSSSPRLARRDHPRDPVAARDAAPPSIESTSGPPNRGSRRTSSAPCTTAATATCGLTTLDGLVRFDGFRFTLFDRSNAEGIGSNRFTPLLETPDGAFWLGTENGGITRYAPGTLHDLHHARRAPVQCGFRNNRRRSGSTLGTQRRSDRRMERPRLPALTGDRVAAVRRLGVVAPMCSGRSTAASSGALFARRADGTHELPDEIAGLVANRIEEDTAGTIWLTLLDGRYAHLAGDDSLRVLKVFPAASPTTPTPPDPDSVTTYTDRRGRSGR